jgi:cell division protein FtsL
MNRLRSSKPVRLVKANLAGLFAFVLLCLLAAVLVLIVLLQHKVRHLETTYYQGLQQQAQLDEEWGRLMLEKSHLSAAGRIERIARERLDMKTPKDQQVILLESEVADDR